jgi:uncharacterized damage-inducible protein DinB
MTATRRKSDKASETTLQEMICAAWKTNNRVTIFLVERLPADFWDAVVPGSPRRTVRMIAGHLHNARRSWIRTLGTEFGIIAPNSVDRYKVGPKELAAALERSGAGILELLQFGCEHGGRIPPARAYVWRNLPLDVGHVLSYFVAHEAHHRGQIVMLARQLGHRLPIEVTGGLWDWSKRVREG